MLKFVKLFLILVFALGYFPLQALAVDDHLDKSCSSHTDLIPLGGGIVYQTFTAGYDRISRYGFYLAGTGNIDLGIRRAGDDWLLVQRTIDINEERFFTMEIVDPIEVTVGDSYEIFARASTPDQIAGFNSDSGCFAGSNANTNGFDSTSDLHFAVYGYNQAELDATPTPTQEPISDNSNTVSDQTNGNSTESVGSAPSENPVVSIEKVTDVKGVFETETQAVKITWKKSATEDIDGYKIFRSENNRTGFKQAGKTAKTELEYLDKNIASDKTYYYFVRAYKGNAESYSSQTITVKVPKFQAKTAVSATATPQSVQKGWFQNNLPYTIPGLILLVAGLAFIFWKFILPKFQKKNIKN